MDGFLLPSMGSCSACRYYIGADLKKQDVIGHGKKKILLVFSDPKEWAASKYDVDDVFNKHHSINISEDCWVYYALRCWKEKSTPKSKHLDLCEPFLKKKIKELKPNLIIVFGERAFKSYTKDHGTVPWRGQYHWDRNICPDLANNCWVCFVQSPSRVLQDKIKTTELLWDQTLQDALAQASEPLPEYKPISECVVLYDTERAAIKFLKSVLKRRPKLTAFDYETSGLQPYVKGHFIRTCAISCSVNHSAAFELTPAIIPYLVKYLKDGQIKKIAQNMVYELIWSRVILRSDVKGLVFDPMLGTHVLDNRKSIGALGMTAFRLLGVDDLKGRANVERYLKSTGEFNTISKAPITPLLTYNALDSLYEHRAAKKQMDAINHVK